MHLAYLSLISGLFSNFFSSDLSLLLAMSQLVEVTASRLSRTALTHTHLLPRSLRLFLPFVRTLACPQLSRPDLLALLCPRFLSVTEALLVSSTHIYSSSPALLSYTLRALYSEASCCSPGNHLVTAHP